MEHKILAWLKKNCQSMGHGIVVGCSKHLWNVTFFLLECYNSILGKKRLVIVWKENS